MIGMITYVNCKHCGGSGRHQVEWGSGEHRIAANIGAIGFWPGITQHNNDRGWNRR